MREEKKKEKGQLCNSFTRYLTIKMMNGFYGYNDNGLNEARRIVGQMSVDDLKRLMSNDDEVTKFVRNLPDV